MIDLTYNAVAAAAESLEQQGLEPSVRLVRDKLGGGSNTRITPLLRQWKEARTARSASGIQINPAISDLILAQIREAAAQASTDANLRARDAEVAYDELAAQVAEVEARLFARDEDLAVARAQLQQQHGQLVERVREMDELRALTAATVAEAEQRAERERGQAETVRQELVRATLRLEAVPDLETALENARQLQKAGSDEIARARQAEAVAVSRGDAQQERAREAAAREAKLEAQLQRMQEEQERAQAAERTAQQEILRLSTVATALDARCAMQQAELEQLRKGLLGEHDGTPSTSAPRRDESCAA